MKKLLAVLAIVVASILSLAAPQAATAPGRVKFTKIAVHPQAALQPTSTGKGIATLQVWNGRLYAGYGDWEANTGPIAINAFDGTNFASSLPPAQLPPCAQGVTTPEACTSDTEATYIFRELLGKLYVPSIDPRGNNSDYAVATSGGPGIATWLNPPGRATHVFDMATLTGSDLWMVGSDGTRAAAWRSLDDGGTWTQMLLEPPSPDDGSNFSRFYGAVAYHGKLYVQPHDYNYSPRPSRVFDPDTDAWSDGPAFAGTMSKANVFADKVIYDIYTENVYGAGALYAFDGVSSAVVHGSARDYTISGGWIYVLGVDGQVTKSQDLVNWISVAPARNNSRSTSIAIFNNAVWVGNTASALYRCNCL